MQIVTEPDVAGYADDHPWSRQFKVIGYRDGGYSYIPHGFFRNWLDEEPKEGSLHIGRCSGFGVGSIAKYDSTAQSLRVGRFVAGGLRLKFLLNGQHESRSISTYMFSIAGTGIRNPYMPTCGDTCIKNDVWMGDEMMMLGGGVIESGCIIGARSLLRREFRSEPYGVYAGVPAKLIRFRFSERIREALLSLAWWEMPLSWIKENNDFFMLDLTADECKSLDALAELKQRKAAAAEQGTGVKEEGCVDAIPVSR